MHWLQATKQSDYQEQIPFAKDWWLVRSAKGSSSVLEYWLEIEIPSGTHQRGGHSQDHVQD